MLLTYHCTWKRQHLLSSQIYKFGVCFVRLPTSVSCGQTSKRCANWIVWRNRNMRTGLHQPQPGLNYIRRNPVCRLRLPGRSNLQLKAGGIGGDNQRKNNYIKALLGRPDRRYRITTRRGFSNASIKCRGVESYSKWILCL